MAEGLQVHSLALGASGICLALLGIVWTARADGLAALGGTAAAGRQATPISPARPLVLGFLLFATFAALTMAIRLPVVRSLDAAFVLMARASGGPLFTRLMRTISNAGGRDLALFGMPFTLLALFLLGQARSLRFFLAAMFGTVGLEGFFKALIHRARPDPRHGAHFASYPSGHALAATILAGALLVIWLPRCRRSWQRALLWGAAGAWSLLMSAARVYLDCHYLTDVGGGILLGAAWTCCCQGLLLALARRSRAVPEARTALLAGETAIE